MPLSVVLPRVIPFLLALFGAAVLSQLENHPWMDSRLSYACKTALVACALVWAWRRCEELARPTSVSMLSWVSAVLVGFGVFVAWINLDIAGLTFSSPATVYVPINDGALDVVWIGIRLAGAVLVVPLAEELFWRSFVARWLQNAQFVDVTPRDLRIVSVSVSAILFGFAHSLWFAGILAGLAYVGLYRYTGSLWVPIVSHAVTNLLLGLWIVHTQSWHFW
jgi:uncharacterized protein